MHTVDNQLSVKLSYAWSFFIVPICFYLVIHKLKYMHAYMYVINKYACGSTIFSGVQARLIFEINL